MRERDPMKAYPAGMLLRGLIVGILLAAVGIAAATGTWWLLAAAALAFGVSLRLIAPSGRSRTH